MHDSPPPDDPLAAIFAGKRDSPRVPSGRMAIVEGRGGTFTARVLDLSQGGVLFSIDDPSFYEAGEDGLRRVQHAFPEGLQVQFPAEALRLPAEIVRLTPHEEGHVAIGCRFQRRVTPEEAILLGTRAADLDHPEVMMAALPFAARPEEPVSLLLTTGTVHSGGPASLGRVQAVGSRLIAALVLAPTLPPADLVHVLLDGSLAAALVRGIHRLWEGPVTLLECRVLVDKPAPTLRLLATEDLPRAVHERFRTER